MRKQIVAAALALLFAGSALAQTEPLIRKCCACAQCRCCAANGPHKLADPLHTKLDQKKGLQEWHEIMER